MKECRPFRATMMRDGSPSVTGGVEASQLTVGARLGRCEAHAPWALLQTEAVVLISIGATAPGRHVEGKESPKFDETVEVAKGDGDGQEHEVTRVPHKEANKLDNLGEAEHEGELSPECIFAVRLLPADGSLPASQQQKRVDHERQGREGSKVESIGAPWLLPKHMALPAQTSPVAAPVASGPARALVQELHALLQGGLNLAFPIVLDPGLHLVADQPASHKVVVVGIENVTSPALRLKALQEVMALQDLRSIGTGAAGHARGSAINVMGGGDLEVAALDVCCTQPVPHACRDRTIELALDPLASAHPSNLRIFEGGQEMGNQGGGPLDIVVCHDHNFCRDMVALEGLADLETLVRLVNLEHNDLSVLEARRPQAVSRLLQSIKSIVGCDQDQLGRFADENALETGYNLLEDIVDSRKDDRHIIRGIRRLLGDRLRLVGPMADTVDEETKVTMNPKGPEEIDPEGLRGDAASDPLRNQAGEADHNCFHYGRVPIQSKSRKVAAKPENKRVSRC